MADVIYLRLFNRLTFLSHIFLFLLFNFLITGCSTKLVNSDSPGARTTAAANKDDCSTLHEI